MKYIINPKIHAAIVGKPGVVKASFKLSIPAMAFWAASLWKWLTFPVKDSLDSSFVENDFNWFSQFAIAVFISRVLPKRNTFQVLAP